VLIVAVGVVVLLPVVATKSVAAWEVLAPAYPVSSGPIRRKPRSIKD
jgi:hypothetical protein